MSAPDPLELTGPVARALLEHALATRPDECCGVLLGPEARRATRALAATNVHENPRTRYRLDAETMLEAVELEEKAPDLQIVGFYHSHPRGAPAFSDEDVARGAWEGKAYVLVCLRPLTFVAGRWTGQGFDGIGVHVPERPES